MVDHETTLTISVSDIEPMKSLLVALGAWSAEATTRDHLSVKEKALLKKVQELLKDEGSD